MGWTGLNLTKIMYMNKKVIIKAYYISHTGLQKEVEWEVDTVGEAKTFIESKSSEYEQPQYELTATRVEEDGYECDVTQFTKFFFSHITVTDYTEGKEIINN